LAIQVVQPRQYLEVFATTVETVAKTADMANIQYRNHERKETRRRRQLGHEIVTYYMLGVRVRYLWA
jgi:hypothetical protein